MIVLRTVTRGVNSQICPDSELCTNDTSNSLTTDNDLKSVYFLCSIFGPILNGRNEVQDPRWPMHSSATVSQIQLQLRHMRGSHSPKANRHVSLTPSICIRHGVFSPSGVSHDTPASCPQVTCSLDTSLQLVCCYSTPDGQAVRLGHQ